MDAESRALETELIRKCLDGDGRFFEPLVRAYEGVSPDGHAEEILADVDAA